MLVAIIIITLILLLLFRFRKIRETFISNVNGQPVYLSGDDINLNINDLREQLVDQVDRYNNTHQWLEVDRIYPNKAINKTTGFDNDQNKTDFPFKTESVSYIDIYPTLPIWNDILNFQDRSKIEAKQGIPVILDNINYYQISDKSQQPIPSKHLTDKIALVQPPFLNQIEINNRDGQLYYNDQRYPEEQVPVEFLISPQKFVKSNTNVYPSYKYLSKI